MKKIILSIVCFFTVATVFSQGYVVINEGSNRILKGFIDRQQVDSSYSWFASNKTGYTPNKDGLAALSQYRDSVQLVVFMGTWCGDSHFIIPKFYALADAAGFSPNRITLFGVDRQKKTLGHLEDAFQVKNVPTIIVMKNGKEIGRVVEYGKFGMWDKELGDVILSGF